jgi:hypothetical protein
MTMACAVGFYLAFQVTTFAKRIPAKMIHARHTITVQTHTLRIHRPEL